MPQHLHLDFETFSKADLKKVGAYRYAFDPSTEILCAAMAIGDREPRVWDSSWHDPWYRVQDELELLRNPSVLIYAHNAMFEMAICQALLQKTWGIPCPDLSRFRCTMSFARRAALPAKLEKLAEVLNLEAKKDNRGRALIKKFSMLPTRATKANPTCKRIRPEDDPAAFAEFCEYCATDVRVEQQVAKKLAYFDEPINNANYSLDAVINARGVPVNLDALRHAQKLIEEETEIVSEKFRKLTGFEVTQNARLLEWAEQCGYNFDNLQADTVDSFLEGQTESQHPVVQALRLKQSIAYASIKKIPAMLACSGPHDNRLRGMMEWHVATTGRWGGKLVQLQNVRRSTMKESEAAYRMICEGCSREMLELCYGPVLETIANCLRHFVEDKQ